MSKRRREPEKTRYALLKTEAWAHPYWMEDGGSRWLNEAGGGFGKGGIGEEVLEWAEVEDYRDLDHKKTGAWLDLKPDSMDGWLAPDGTYHPCDYSGHLRYADLFLKRPTRELEEQGWARCHSPGGGQTDPWFHLGDGKRLTAEQRNTLSARGFVVEEWD